MNMHNRLTTVSRTGVAGHIQLPTNLTIKMAGSAPGLQELLLPLWRDNVDCAPCTVNIPPLLRADGSYSQPFPFYMTIRTHPNRKYRGIFPYRVELEKMTLIQQTAYEGMDDEDKKSYTMMYSQEEWKESDKKCRNLYKAHNTLCRKMQHSGEASKQRVISKVLEHSETVAEATDSPILPASVEDSHRAAKKARCDTQSQDGQKPETVCDPLTQGFEIDDWTTNRRHSKQTSSDIVGQQLQSVMAEKHSMVVKHMEEFLKRPFQSPQPLVASSALSLPLLLQCSYRHATYGPIKVTARLVYVDQCQADGVKIRPGQFENYIQQPKFSKPLRALYCHQILCVRPAGTPLDALQNEWFSSFHRSSRYLGHGISGWQAWSIIGLPDFSISRAVERLGFVSHPTLDTDIDVPVDHWSTDPQTGKAIQSIVPCPVRDVLAVFCRHECDEVRCGRPRDESSCQYYECPHGLEYRRNDPIDATVEEIVSEQAGTSKKKKKNPKLTQTTQPSVAASTWAGRIRFLTIEGAKEYINRIVEIQHKVHGEINRLIQPEWKDVYHFDNLCSAILCTDEDLSTMLKYWEPETQVGHRPKIRCFSSKPTFTPVQWRIKPQFRLPFRPALSATVMKCLTEEVCSSLKQRIASGEVQTFC